MSHPGAVRTLVSPPTSAVGRRPLALLAAALVVLLAGCGSEPADPDAPSGPVTAATAAPSTSAASPSAAATPEPGATPSAGPTTPADEVAIDITLENGTVSPNGKKIDVRKGQTVALTVTSDHDDEVHVHGDYDIDLEVASGTTVRKTFVADKTGSVEVESHHPEKIIAILNVR